jgi:YidC/Oxa1 family membrane protein insertase
VFDWAFQGVAWLMATFYGWVPDYAFAIALMAVVVMLVLTPLTLKSTKGMLEMQRLQPEMRRLQAEHRGDRQKLNEAMMRLYQEHKVNPLASCLPLLAQMPVFIVLFRLVNGLTFVPEGGTTFAPRYLDESTALYQSLEGADQMRALGLDLSRHPIDVMRGDFVGGLPYAGLVVVLALVYLVQQRMVASRTVSPTMSASQARLLQYMPVAFAFFQLILPTSLVVYYLAQAVIRIGQQQYITVRFYRRDDSLGRQAQAASAAAREIAEREKKEGRGGQDKKSNKASEPFSSKRVTPPKGGASARPSSSPGSSRRHPTPPGSTRSGQVRKSDEKGH